MYPTKNTNLHVYLTHNNESTRIITVHPKNAKAKFITPPRLVCLLLIPASLVLTLVRKKLFTSLILLVRDPAPANALVNKFSPLSTDFDDQDEVSDSEDVFDARETLHKVCHFIQGLCVLGFVFADNQFHG